MQLAAVRRALAAEPHQSWTEDRPLSSVKHGDVALAGWHPSSLCAVPLLCSSALREDIVTLETLLACAL